MPPWFGRKLTLKFVAVVLGAKRYMPAISSPTGSGGTVKYLVYGNVRCFFPYLFVDKRLKVFRVVVWLPAFQADIVRISHLYCFCRRRAVSTLLLHRLRRLFWAFSLDVAPQPEAETCLQGW